MKILSCLSDRIIKTKTFQNMSAEFQRQSTKNLDSIKETVLRLANNIPQERLENTAITPNQIKDSLQLSKVPGLIALPKTKRSSIDFSGMEDQIASNIFFQEDFQSDDAFLIAFEDKVIRERTTNPLTWSKTVQDFIIAGLFSMTYTSAVFPFKGIGETSRALYNLTKEQAKVLTNQEIARRWITGPAGTGKTWLLIASTMKTNDAFMERKRGKGRIMVLTFNVAVKNFIKDTIDKLIEHSKIPNLSTANRSNSDKPKCEIKLYTIDGLKEHMKKEMIGKAKSCVKLSKGLKEQEWDDTMGRIVDEDNFDEVFQGYQKFVTDATLSENFGFDSIFVDEAQDILQSNNGWISKIWRRKAKTPKYSKLWIFGDKSQNLYGFRDHETNEESLLDLQDDDFTQKLTHQLRSTNDIFERYHKARYEDQDDDTIEGNSATETDESESDDEDISDIHCNKCEMKPSGILGGKVEEMNCNRDSITTKLTAKIVSLVKDEKVLIEDIALLCVHYQDVEFLKTSTLKSLLAARNTGLGTGNGNIVICNAEDFATKCSKIRNKIQRKRKNEGNVVQKKFLMIDTVRRFKGLDAEVKSSFLVQTCYDRFPHTGCLILKRAKVNGSEG